MNTRTILAAASLATALPASVFAQDDEPMVAAEATATETEWSTTVDIGGFVDGSALIPITGYAADSDQVTFGLDQVEIDVEVAPSEDVLIRADINYFPAAGVPTADQLVEQGFFDYSIGEGGFFQMGKRNAPIGAESIDPVDMYQYSYGQLFVNSTPSNLTGFFGGYRSDAFSGMVFLTNYWDTPTSPRSVTPGGRIQYGFGAGHVAVSGTYGPATSDDPYAMVDVDAAIGAGDLTLLAEANYGASDAVTSVGGLLTANYALTDSFSGTLRVDYLNRDDVENPIDQASVTLAGLIAVADGYGVTTELRADLPSGADAILTGAVEFTAYW